MGTDIHIAVEVRVRGKWKNIKSDIPFDFSNRNYYLFGLLSDVRKPHETGGILIPGIPADASKKSLELVNNTDIHSVGSGTLGLIKRHNWTDRKYESSGWCNIYDYQKFLNGARPYLTPRIPSWGQNKGGKEVSIEEADKLIRLIVMENSDNDVEILRTSFVFIKTFISDSDMTNFDEIIPPMHDIGVKYKVKSPDEDVRLIVGYDN